MILLFLARTANQAIVHGSATKLQINSPLSQRTMNRPMCSERCRADSSNHCLKLQNYEKTIKCLKVKAYYITIIPKR
jgi:hypothetical protein